MCVLKRRGSNQALCKPKRLLVLCIAHNVSEASSQKSSLKSLKRKNIQFVVFAVKLKTSTTLKLSREQTQVSKMFKACDICSSLFLLLVLLDHAIKSNKQYCGPLEKTMMPP